MRLFALLLATSMAASAQVEAPVPTPIGPTLLAEGPTADVTDETETERAVRAIVSEPGIHVVHLWASWCGNSRAVLESGWYEVIEANPDVSFSFVSIWNDGDDGADRLARYGIEAGGNVRVFAQPDHGPSANRDLRRTTFLGLPLSWTPTTWVFNREGKLAAAFNYGEVSADLLETLLEVARSDWYHD